MHKNAKTYNSGDSLVVTHLTTNPPVHCLYMAERTGSLIFSVLWSYVKEMVDVWICQAEKPNYDPTVRTSKSAAKRHRIANSAGVVGYGPLVSCGYGSRHAGPACVSLSGPTSVEPWI